MKNILEQYNIDFVDGETIVSIRYGYHCIGFI